MMASRGWDIQYNLNKYYTGFKLGNKVVFNVAWGGTYAWKLKFKLPEDAARDFEGELWGFQRYDPNFHEAIFQPLQPDSPDIAELEALFIQAYKYVSGIK